MLHTATSTNICRVAGRLVPAALVMAATMGCWSSSDDVVVYTALDREFSESLFDEFYRETGIKVRAKYDSESTKTVNLTNALLAEASRPRCDVFWNNEILHTLRLDRRGLLAPCDSTVAARWPADYRSPDGHWFGFAARARVLIVNTDLVTADEQPTSILALVDPKWKSRVAIAKPLFGTTATHSATLFAHWGREKAQAFFADVAANALVMSGNRRVAVAVARGQVAWGLTDTDDAMLQLEAGFPVHIVFPDQEPDQMGALFIPNTVALIRGAPHRASAVRLVEYLISPDTEARLARGPSAQMPLDPSATVKSRVPGSDTARRMSVDFAAALEAWDEASDVLRELFHSP